VDPVGVQNMYSRVGTRRVRKRKMRTTGKGRLHLALKKTGEREEGRCNFPPPRRKIGRSRKMRGGRPESGDHKGNPRSHIISKFRGWGGELILISFTLLKGECMHDQTSRTPRNFTCKRTKTSISGGCPAENERKSSNRKLTRESRNNFYG